MSRIPITGGFTLIPEGYHVFRIYKVIQDEDFGKIEIYLVNAKGITHRERFSLKNADDTYNESALNAFSFFAKVALNDYSIESVEPSELVDHYIKAEVIHKSFPNKNDPTKTVTFANLGDKEPADGFDEEPCQKALTLGKSAPTPTQAETPKANSGLDLDSLLGGL